MRQRHSYSGRRGQPFPEGGPDGPHDTNLTLALYARHMQRRDGEPERLRALIEGAEWANDGPMKGVGHSPGRPTTGQNRP